MARFSILADPELADVSNTLRKRLETLANEIAPEDFSEGVLGPLMKAVLASSFCQVDACEGALWLADQQEEFLVPVFNSGPESDKFVGKFKQPLNSGLISMVYATEQPFCENEVHQNSQHDKTIDTAMNRVTVSMVAVPLFFGCRVRGVISCVRLKSPASDAPVPPMFCGKRMREMQLTAETVQRLIEHRLISIALDW